MEDDYPNPAEELVRNHAARFTDRPQSRDGLLGAPRTHWRLTPNISQHPAFREPQQRRYSESIYDTLDEADVTTYPVQESITDRQPPPNFSRPVPTAYKGRAGYVPVQGHVRLWSCFWLQKAVLIGFTALFSGLLAALVLLWYYDAHARGFPVSESTSHYAWTYGPTGVLVIVVGLWRQVDYHCKSLLPWAQMRRGPVIASKSLLLDYVSPFQVVTFWRAARNGHVLVLATITGFGLLKLLTIFSTGLFVVVAVPTTDDDFPITISTTFNSSLFDPSQFNNSQADFSTAPVYAYYSTLVHGLPFPAGVQNDFAYSTIQATNIAPANVTLTAEVDAFVPQLNCSIVDIQLGSLATFYGSNNASNVPIVANDSLSLVLPDGDICSHWAFVDVPVQDPQFFVVPPRQLTGTVQPVYCSVKNPGKVNSSKTPDAYLYTLTDVRYAQTLFANHSELKLGQLLGANSSRKVEQITNVLCTPSYSITRVNMTNDTTSLSSGGSIVPIQPLAGVQNRTLPGLSSQNLASAFFAATEAAATLFGSNKSDLTTSPQVQTTLFSLMSLNQNSLNYSVLLNAASMRSAAESTFAGIMSLYAQQELTSPANITTTGTALFSQNRLLIRTSSLWVMVAAFGILIALALVVLFSAPLEVISRSPHSIGTMAAVLTRSSELNRVLQKITNRSKIEQQAALSGSAFRTVVQVAESGQHAFRILGSGEVQTETVDEEPIDARLQWWHPMTLNFPLLLLTLILPLAAIAGLELLQRSSNTHKGLLTVQDNNYTEAYIHYIPALIMLLIATLFNSLDFNIATFAPFSALRRGNAKSIRSIMSQLNGKIPPLVLLESARIKQFNALLSTLAALAASVFAIIVSGLYEVERVDFLEGTKSLLRRDTFNLAWSDSFTNDNGAGAVISLIEHMNLTYPGFTYSELAFPKFSIGPFTSAPTGQFLVSGTPYASIPAIRANLDCSIVPKSNFTVVAYRAGEFNDYTTDQAFVEVVAGLPSTCQLAGYRGNSSTVHYTINFELTDDSGVFGGKQVDLVFGTNSTLFGDVGEDEGQYIGDSPAGCPSLIFTFGHFALNSTDTTNVTTMVCSQQMQQVMANVTFLAGTTTIDTRFPPSVNESTVTLLENRNSGFTSFEYRIQENLANEVSAFNGAGFASADRAALSIASLDAFYQAVTKGIESVPLESLLGPHNEQQLFNATQHFYRKYMAQVANAVMREDVSSSQKRQTTLNDLQVTISRVRLMQNAASKLTLQILLGVAVVCGAAAYLLTKMRRVLRANPCSIFGMMATLAGSSICYAGREAEGVCDCCGRPRDTDGDDDAEDGFHESGERGRDREVIIPDGAEWMSDKELRRVFVGYRYSLGWWNRKRGRGERFGIDIGPATGVGDDQDWQLSELRSGRRAIQRSSRIPNWMLGPLRPDGAYHEGGDTDMRMEMRSMMGRGGTDIAKRPSVRESKEKRPRSSRMPGWLLGPLRPEKGQYERADGEGRKGRSGSGLGITHEAMR